MRSRGSAVNGNGEVRPLMQSDEANSSTKNPFLYTTPLSYYEIIKMTIMCLLGVPLWRVILLTINFLVIGFVGYTSLIGFTPIDPVTKRRNPLPTWRVWASSPVPILLRFALFIIGFYWIPVIRPAHGKAASKFSMLCGRFNHEQVQPLIISNHVSFLDGVYYAATLAPSIAMKAEMAELPIFGRILQLWSPLLINRFSPEGRHQALEDIQDHIRNHELPPLLLFPEGTTSNQHYLTKFKVGAFTAGSPVSPIVITYPNKHHDLSWVPGVNTLGMLFRTLCQVYNRMEVRCLPPYFPSEFEKQHPAQFAENVRQQMAQAQGMHCTNHAFEDVTLLFQAKGINYANKYLVSLTDVGEIRSLTALRNAEIGALVKYFREHDTDADGKLSPAELAKLFPEESKEMLIRLTEVLDTNGDGSIDFRELCYALQHLNTGRQECAESMIKFAFDLFDLNGDGNLDMEELRQMVGANEVLFGMQAAQVDDIQAKIENRQDGMQFEEFERLVQERPSLLGFAKSKLETLKGISTLEDTGHTTKME